MILKLKVITRHFKSLFMTINLIDLSAMKRPSSNSPKTISATKFYNVITTSHFTLSSSELENLNNLNARFNKLSHFDQYSLISKLTTHILNVYKNVETNHALPKLQYLQLVFDLMECNANIFNLLTFVIHLAHVGPLLEQYLRAKFMASGETPPKFVYFEYLSHFYVNIVSVFRLHVISLTLWKDLAIEAFKT